MSLHSNFQPAKRGLTDTKIANAKRLRQRINGFHDDTTNVLLAAASQRAQLRYSDQGDFTRCYRGGF